MRDLVVSLIVFGSLPVILMRPWTGILMWCWLGFMNPHRLTWGFAYDFPFAMIVGLTTLVAFVFTRDRKPPPATTVLVLWVIFVVWCNISTPFALNQADAIPEWSRFVKVQLFCFLSLFLMQGKDRIVALVWVIAASLGFYGLKGGIFAAATGGEYKVYGPPGSFFDDNNAVGLVLIMTIPLLRFLQLQFKRKEARLILTFVMLCSAAAILSTGSRGAFLAGFAMLALLIVRGRRRLVASLVTIVAVPAMLLAMPQSWWDRMSTIESYQQDGSAMGRINAWHFAYNLALDHPVVGGGFSVFTPDLFRRYAPNPNDFHDSHSIYFEVLGEQGFVGLALFVALFIAALVLVSRTVHAIRTAPAELSRELTWAADLAGMLQVSLVAFAVGGAFLGLAYFDLYYTIIAMILLVDQHVRATLAAPVQVVSQAPAPQPAARSVTNGHPNPYGATLRRAAEPDPDSVSRTR